MNGPCSNMFKLDVQGQAAPSFFHRIAASPCMHGSKQEWGLTAHTSGYAACTFFLSVFFCQLCAFAWIGRTCFIKQGLEYVQDRASTIYHRSDAWQRMKGPYGYHHPPGRLAPLPSYLQTWPPKVAPSPYLQTWPPLFQLVA